MVSSVSYGSIWRSDLTPRTPTTVLGLNCRPVPFGHATGGSRTSWFGISVRADIVVGPVEIHDEQNRPTDVGTTVCPVYGNDTGNVSSAIGYRVRDGTRGRYRTRRGQPRRRRDRCPKLGSVRRIAGGVAPKRDRAAGRASVARGQRLRVSLRRTRSARTPRVARRYHPSFRRDSALWRDRTPASD